MTKSLTIFSCSHCGAQFQKWVGRCLECGKWDTIIQEEKELSSFSTNPKFSSMNLVKLSDINDQDILRCKTNISELDRVLGGGLVKGSLVLFGGEPGIGKSTLALQLATLLSNTIYVSGEESIQQIKIRFNRLKLKDNNLKIANETNVEAIIEKIKKEKPDLVIIDSIQTISSFDTIGEAGNISQVRNCTIKLMELAKTENITVILIGQVTKEGLVAGPKTLEHLVDTVLYLEGDRFNNFRILRAVKNRFGSTDEVGVFSMETNGLIEVKNPSSAFIENRAENSSGNILTCLIEGTRPILVEVQALVNKTSFGYPVRKASGFDLNRLHVLIAVLQKRAGLHLEQYDIHLNIVGGINAEEPAVDLAVALAIASAYKDKILSPNMVVFGEVGLSGEVRPISQLEKRLKESENLGIKIALTNLSKKNSGLKMKNLKIMDIKNIQELIKHT